MPITSPDVLATRQRMMEALGVTPAREPWLYSILSALAPATGPAGMAAEAMQPPQQPMSLAPEQGPFGRVLRAANPLYGALLGAAQNPTLAMGVLPAMLGQPRKIMRGKRLFRAAEKPQAGLGASFSPDIETARAYTDNPGFGGPTIYKFELPQDAKVLDVSRSPRPLEAFGDALGEDGAAFSERMRYEYGLMTPGQVLENIPDILEKLEARGFDWLQFTDDFPEGATTMMKLTSEPIEGKWAGGKRPKKGKTR